MRGLVRIRSGKHHFKNKDPKNFGPAAGKAVWPASSQFPRREKNTKKQEVLAAALGGKHFFLRQKLVNASGTTRTKFLPYTYTHTLHHTTSFNCKKTLPRSTTAPGTKAKESPCFVVGGVFRRSPVEF